MDYSFSDISSVTDSIRDQARQNLNANIKTQIQNCYNSYQSQIEKIYSQKDAAVDEIHEKYANLLYDKIEKDLEPYQNMLNQIQEQINNGKNLGLYAKKKELLLKQKQDKKRKIEQEIQQDKKSELDKIKFQFQRKLDSKKRESRQASRLKNTIRTSVSQKRSKIGGILKLGGFQSGASSLASLHSQLTRSSQKRSVINTQDFQFSNQSKPTSFTQAKLLEIRLNQKNLSPRSSNNNISGLYSSNPIKAVKLANQINSIPKKVEVQL